MKAKIALWYKQGLWTTEMVHMAVDKAIITEEDYKEICESE